jgi:hypothetical protein
VESNHQIAEMTETYKFTSTHHQQRHVQLETTGQHRFGIVKELGNATVRVRVHVVRTCFTSCDPIKRLAEHTHPLDGSISVFGVIDRQRVRKLLVVLTRSRISKEFDRIIRMHLKIYNIRI